MRHELAPTDEAAFARLLVAAERSSHIQIESYDAALTIFSNGRVAALERNGQWLCTSEGQRVPAAFECECGIEIESPATLSIDAARAAALPFFQTGHPPS